MKNCLSLTFYSEIKTIQSSSGVNQGTDEHTFSSFLHCVCLKKVWPSVNTTFGDTQEDQLSSLKPISTGPSNAWLRKEPFKIMFAASGCSSDMLRNVCICRMFNERIRVQAKLVKKRARPRCSSLPPAPAAPLLQGVEQLTPESDTAAESIFPQLDKWTSSVGHLKNVQFKHWPAFLPCSLSIIFYLGKGWAGEGGVDQASSLLNRMVTPTITLCSLISDTK